MLGAVFSQAAFSPLEVHIGDTVEKVDSTLGKRFEDAGAMKMTDSTRAYAQRKVLVSFKARKVCLIEYMAALSQEDAFALLTREATADQWILDRTDTTNYGTMRFYHTADNRLVGHIAEGRSVTVSTREVDY